MNPYHRWLCRSNRLRKKIEPRTSWVLDSLDLGPEVLEVGPGPGLTTDRLRRDARHVTAVEIDPDKVAQLPIINDFAPAGALPLLKLEVNGHPVEFILDTGGDMLYIDESVAEKVGIRHVAKRQFKYAYTGGKYVDEPLGVADTVKMGEVTLKNVPVIVAKWKLMGPTSDGVVTTQMLKQLLSTVDYDKKEITLRERSEAGKRQLLETFGSSEPVRMPFWMTATHLMFTKGSINGRKGLNLFVDSGLASSMPMVILDETAEDLGIADKKADIQGTKYYWVPLASLGIADITSGATQALGNVMVEKDSYWARGPLISTP